MTIIDIPSQFRKLCQSYSRCIDLPLSQMLEIVVNEAEGEEFRSNGFGDKGDKPHWSYDANRLAALRELKKAMEDEK